MYQMDAKLQKILDKAIDAVVVAPEWPQQYINSDTGRIYTPHTQEEYDWVYSDTPRYCLIKGGEGSGKSVAGIIKTLERLRRGMSGVMVSHNLPHFKKSTWAEFRRWCPWDLVPPSQQHRRSKEWQPHEATFSLVISNMYGGFSELICGGIDKPIRFEGPNLHFAYVDEMRGMADPEVVRVLTGRTRLVGPKGEPPQLFVTSTPARPHFMYDYFGPIKEKDPHFEFKQMAKVITLRTIDNVAAGNLDEEFVEARGAPLNEQEKLIRLEGEWGDGENDNRFIENMFLWDSLEESLPPLAPKGKGGWADAVVLGVDGAVSRDNFAVVGVTRHPNDRKRLAVRFCKIWRPPDNGKIDFLGTEGDPGPELFIRNICKQYNVLEIAYDVTQLHDMMSRLFREGLAWCSPFSQQNLRAIADQDLYDYIIQKKLAHSGDPELREHISNAGSKIDDDSKKRRLVKIISSYKIDAAVALSMACYECMRLNI